MVDGGKPSGVRSASESNRGMVNPVHDLGDILKTQQKLTLDPIHCLLARRRRFLCVRRRHQIIYRKAKCHSGLMHNVTRLKPYDSAICVTALTGRIDWFSLSTRRRRDNPLQNVKAMMF
jgi:hypothetical protein